MWDVADPTQPRQLGFPLVAHTSYIDTVAFSHDGSTLATGSHDHTVVL